MCSEKGTGLSRCVIGQLGTLFLKKNVFYVLKNPEHSVFLNKQCPSARD